MPTYRMKGSSSWKGSNIRALSNPSTVVSASFFGGAIPYYACREDARMAVLYMADCGRLRVREALNGLWTAGL